MIDRFKIPRDACKLRGGQILGFYNLNFITIASFFAHMYLVSVFIGFPNAVSKARVNNQ